MTNLLYTDVEDSLRGSVRALLEAKAPWDTTLAATEAGHVYATGLWASLACDLGVAGLPVPESNGGQGGSWREVAVVAEELGRCVAPTPFLGSAVVSTALVAGVGEPGGALLRELAEGRSTAAVLVPSVTAPGGGYPGFLRTENGRLTGTVRGVMDALGADRFIVPAFAPEPTLLLVDAGPAVELRRLVSLDMTRPLAEVRLDAVPGEVLATGEAAVSAVEAALVAGSAVLASEQLGVTQRCLELSVEYACTRRQFGRVIGGFQALKHRLADVWTDLTQARAVARNAADALATGADAALAASLAQALCGPVALRAAQECIQVHGGIGFTWEHPAHLYLKRAKADSLAFGTASRHRARVADLVDLPSGAGAPATA
jgi:alkylation response protein AidB-like acyl-CoA dehydrogenase